MNTFKKTGGFTLVELIIVIAILAILSSVAVAGYSRYIEKANEAANDAWETEIRTAATLANARYGAVTVTFVPGTGENVNKIFVIVHGTLGGDAFEEDFEFSVSGLTGEIYTDASTIPQGATGAVANDYVGIIAAP